MKSSLLFHLVNPTNSTNENCSIYSYLFIFLRFQCELRDSVIGWIPHHSCTHLLTVLYTCAHTHTYIIILSPHTLLPSPLPQPPNPTPQTPKQLEVNLTTPLSNVPGHPNSPTTSSTCHPSGPSTLSTSTPHPRTAPPLPEPRISDRRVLGCADTRSRSRTLRERCEARASLRGGGGERRGR